MCRDCTNFGPIPDAGLSLIEPFVDEGRSETAGVLAHFRRRNDCRHPLAARPSDMRDPIDFDASRTFGATWVHGSWDAREPGWVLATSATDRVS